MKKNPLVKRGLAIGIILLFISIIFIPSINFTVVRASNDGALVQVTIQAYGIKGFENTTVILTKQQYQNIEQCLDEFQTRLKQTSTRDKAIPLFKEALIQLNQNGLLPNEMDVVQAQKLVVEAYSKYNELPIFENIFHENNLQENQHNLFCFVSGVVLDGYATGPLGLIGGILALLIFPLQILGLILMGISEIIVTVLPFSIMQGITIFSANLTSLGLLGYKNHILPPHSGTGKIFGFNGIKITNIDTGEINLLGFALAVIDFSND
ncbi:unnamed protein product [marine sediment metagenome]|uniref:Uncharacterized protein n=1 Tax=marine sediment metagenome TaxID=412755 RepID=X0ZEF1_9ZZZZ